MTITRQSMKYLGVTLFTKKRESNVRILNNCSFEKSDQEGDGMSARILLESVTGYICNRVCFFWKIYLIHNMHSVCTSRLCQHITGPKSLSHVLSCLFKRKGMVELWRFSIGCSVLCPSVYKRMQLYKE